MAAGGPGFWIVVVVTSVAVVYWLATWRIPRRAEILYPVIRDINHRDHCPRKRLKTYKQIASDGAEVTVGHCDDCGATAYRRGSS
jgi:hypothetical protein